ncbi:MAG: NFACT RNA binding domain-containing protein [Planctomycetota bacterium]
MISAADVARWTSEAGPALRGAFVHRVWRPTDDGLVILARHHQDQDPEAPAVRRVAWEVALGGDWLRAVALRPEDVQADDKQLKKAWSKDAHPFLGLLRKHLVGAQITGLVAAEGDRIAFLDVTHTREPAEGPRELRLAVELFGRQGNAVLAAPPGDPRCLGSLFTGRGARPFTRGTPYELPPSRDGEAPPATLALDVDPDPERLSLGRAVAEVQREIEETARASGRLADLRRAAKQGLKRLQGLVKKLERQLAEVEQADLLERQADLLKANLGALPARAPKVEVTDYAAQPEPETLSLELDPTKTVQENMQALYKKAKKLRKGDVAVRTRLGETDARCTEAQALVERAQALSEDDADALDAFEEALRKEGLLPKEQKAKQPKQQVNQGPRSFRTLEGHEVLVGRNDDENDKLTMRTARGRDLFFHVRGCPGSHVILRVDPKRPPNHESLIDAGTLAAYYSKARTRGAVDVSYTPRKWVKKPKGAKPGLVQISNARTVRAGGDPERLQRLLNSRSQEDA